jgi:hypothetical protein
MPSGKVIFPVRINLKIGVCDLQIFLFFKTFVFFLKELRSKAVHLLIFVCFTNKTLTYET